MPAIFVNKIIRSASCIISLLVIGGCDVGQIINQGLSGTTNRPLQIWWSEGYYPEETEAIQTAISNWKTESGQEIELTFYSEKDLVAETENALLQGNPPDIVYGYSIDTVLLPNLAWNDKLADVTSIIDPLKDQYLPQALESVYYFNGQKSKRSYYAIPISQAITHIHYWDDLLAKADIDGATLPQDWQPFWTIWETAQNTLRGQGSQELYGLGLPMSDAATDTNNIFEQFLEAYNVELMDGDGNLKVNEPTIRQGIIQALKNYTDFYVKGFVPPKAIAWNDPDNNVFFLSNLTIMTANATLSIPGSQRQDPINYYDRMRTIPWPNKPDGKPMVNITSVKQIAILANSPHLDEAKSLVAFLVQPENLTAFIEGSQGRFFPVMPALMERPIWNDPKDPHLFNLKAQFDLSRPTYTVVNPAYSNVLAQNVWGQAIQRILIEKNSPEQAADLAIKQIEQIFKDWK